MRDLKKSSFKIVSPVVITADEQKRLPQFAPNLPSPVVVAIVVIREWPMVAIVQDRGEAVLGAIILGAVTLVGVTVVAAVLAGTIECLRGGYAIA
jgi:hypothetical protein